MYTKNIKHNQYSTVHSNAIPKYLYTKRNLARKPKTKRDPSFRQGLMSSESG